MKDGQGAFGSTKSFCQPCWPSTPSLLIAKGRRKNQISGAGAPGPPAIAEPVSRRPSAAAENIFLIGRVSLAKSADHCASLPVLLDVLQDHIRESAGLILGQHAGWSFYPRLDHRMIGMNSKS